MSLDRSSNDLRAYFFDMNNNAMLLFNKNLILIDCNEIVFKGVQFNKDQIIGLHVTQFYPNAEKEGWLELYKKVLETGEIIVKEEYKPHPSLGNNITRVKCFKVEEGLGVNVEVITESKQTYYDLETFVYKVSHDLRTPVVNLLGLIDMIKSESNRNDYNVDALEMIENQTKILDRILKNLIKTLQLKINKAEFEIIDFNSLIDEILDSLSHMDGIKEIFIEKKINIQKTFYSNKVLLTFLLQNIFNNAIKFKRQIHNSRIEIEVNELNNGLNIIIFDNGIGISEKEQYMIYDLFHKGEHFPYGNGLGLFTVFQILQKLDGFIKCQSNEGEYTKFSIYIPNNPL